MHSLLPIGRQVFSHLQQSRAPSHVAVAWEDKWRHSEHPPPPSFFFPQLYVLSMALCGVGHPSGHSLMGGVRSRKDLGSAVTKTTLCYQHHFQHKSKT